MTDTTDIAALRNKFGNKLPTPEQARERFTELLNSPHGTSWFLAPHAIALLDALEAERQRADANAQEIRRLEFQWENRAPTQWAYDQACSALHAQRERAEKAEAEIESLKAKLANPVVLKDFRTTSIQSTRPFNLFDIIIATQGADAEAIIAAGFTVKGE